MSEPVGTMLPPSPPSPVPRAASALRSLLEWAVIIVGALVAALLIKAFLVQAFFIPSASMEPTLLIGDRVLVSKLSYHLHDVHRGDIVVFKRPPEPAGEAGDPNIKDLIKRVIGLPGDVIESKGGSIYINDRRLDEPYLPRGTVTDSVDRQTIPPGHFYVMGDNRQNSRDSRFFHSIPKSLIAGRAFVRIWPLGAFHFF